VTRIVLDFLAIALGGAGGLAGLLTLRQRKQLLSAQAEDVRATGQARIMDAAGRIVEQQADLVPDLLERISRLEERDESRQAELDAVLRYVDESQRWMQQALRLVRELGGDIPEPPPAPARALVFPRPKPPQSSLSASSTSSSSS